MPILEEDETHPKIIRARAKKITPIYKLYQLYRYRLKLYGSLDRLAGYLRFQLTIASTMYRDRKIGHDRSDVPIPPARLRYRVHGSLDRESFLTVGRIVAENIQDLLAPLGRDIYSFENVLDFGCGSGRVLRFFRNAPPSCRLHGTDIDPALVKWCVRHMPGVRWSTNGFTPPTAYPDDTFDLIYAISVFTHLDQSFERAWLGELQRIAKPAGILILTVHGEHVYQALPAPDLDEIRSRGFLYVTGTTGRLKLDGLPDFYQTAYHSREYVAREWSRYFEILRYADRAIGGYQDAVLLRKR